MRSSASLLPLGLVVLALVVGCPLDTTVRYRCEPDRTCGQPGFECGDDDLCRPVMGGGEAGGGLAGGEAGDAGTGGGAGGGGPCVPRDKVTACQPVECGFVRDGCGREYDCGKWCPIGQECGVLTPNACGFASLRTSDGWTWENPLPHGLNLNGLFRLDARHAWMVGEGGSVVFFDGERSRLEAVPAAGATLHGVHASRANDVFAVGANGTVVRFDGTTWVKESVSPPVTATLRAVWTYGNGTAVAAGDNATVLFRNTSGVWSSGAVTGTMGDVLRLWHLPGQRTFGLTRQGVLIGLAPSSLSNWVTLEAIPFSTPRGLVGRGEQLYVTGITNGRTTLGRRDPDGGWQRVVHDAGVNLQTLAMNSRELWGLAQTSASSVSTYTFDTGDLSLQTIASTQANLSALELAEDSDEAFAIGPGGNFAVGRAGLPLSIRNTGFNRIINAVCGYGTGTNQMVATSGVTVCGGTCNPQFLERQVTGLGVTWAVRTQALGGTRELLGCYALGPNRMWLTGDDSKFFHQQNGAWQYGDFTGAFGGQYRGGWGLPDAGYFFVRTGETSVTASADGVSNFFGVTTNATTPLNAISGTTPDDVLAVGNGGALTSRVRGVWSSTSVVSNDLMAVHGATLAGGGSLFLAGGMGGAVVVRAPDGGVETALVDNTLDFSGAWTSSDGTGYLVGRERLPAMGTAAWVGRKRPGDAAWQRFDGVQYNRGLTGITGLETDAGTVLFIVGPQGTILRRGP